MIPAPFRYARVGSVGEAVDLLVEHGEDAKVLAGGHSLLPILKLRLARPEVLIDIGRLADLDYVRVEGDEVAIGALTRHESVVQSAVLRREVPLLPHVAKLVGDPQVRRRGTFGGSLVHGDSAADLPAAVLALDGTFVMNGPAGRREVPAAEFFLDYFQTAVQPDELLIEVRVPRLAGVGWGYEKFVRRANDWAIVGVAAVAGRVALVNMAATPVRASATELALADGADPPQAAALAADGTAPTEDMHAGPEYRRHLARVLTGRALLSARGAGPTQHG